MPIRPSSWPDLNQPASTEPGAIQFNEDLETEMWKLIHWRAPLKVIINYDWSEDEKTTTARKEYVTRKLEKLRHMHSVVDEFHPENPQTEYLFLMGTRKAIDGEIIWCRV